MKQWVLPGVSLGYILGVAVGSVVDYPSVSILSLLLMAGILSFWMAFRQAKVFLVLCSSVFMVTGMVLASRTVEHYQSLGELSNVSGSGTVRGEMIPGTYTARIVVTLDDCGATACPREAVQVEVDRFGSWADGERVRIGPCDLKRPERFDPAFDYPLYLAKEGIGFVAKQCPVALMDTEGSRWRYWLHRTRVFVGTAITDHLPEPEAGLARGLLLGGNDELPETVAKDFRTVGLSHIVAVSGYNLSALAGALFVCGIMLGWYRKQAVWVTLIGIIVFVLLVGAPASAVRAALMAIIGLGALLASRPTRGIPILLVAAAVMLLFNPLLLRYDIGFQLSYMATLAILLSTEWRAQFHVRSWIGEGLLETVLITTVVLLFVTPLSLWHFGTLSPYALLANMLALPLVPLAFLLAFLIVPLGWLPGIGTLCGWLAYGFLHSLVMVAESLAHFPWATATYTDVSLLMLGCWYLFWIFFFTRSRISQ